MEGKSDGVGVGEHAPAPTFLQHPVAASLAVLKGGHTLCLPRLGRIIIFFLDEELEERKFK